MNSVESMLGGLAQQFEQGQHAQVPDDQLHQNYGQVVSPLSPADYQQSATAAFQQLAPDQRSQLADMLRQKASELGVSTPALGIPPAVAASDPNALATAATAVHQQNPNLLQQILAPGGMFSSPIAKLALMGITAYAARRLGGR